MDSNSTKYSENTSLPPTPIDQDHSFIEEAGSLMLKATFLRMIPFVALARGGIKLFARHPLSFGLPIAFLAYLYKTARDLEDESYVRRSQLH